METKSTRSWVSIGLLFTLLGMALTGLLSYLLPYHAYTSAVHTWFGFVFIGLMVFHLSNNGRALIGYVRQDRRRRRLGSAIVFSLTILIGLFVGLPPFTSLIETGQKIRQVKGVEAGSYQTIFTRVGQGGTDLRIELRAGPAYESEPQPLFLGLTYRATPQVVFWVEDFEGRYLDTLFVTKKVSNSSFGSLSGESLRRPEALPYWSHKRGVRYADGLMTPDASSQEFDGVTAATPTGHYDLQTVVNATTAIDPRLRIKMEVNRSYDFNHYYHKDKFPEDSVYSGSGSSGQPSVIYEAVIDPRMAPQFVVMQAIGHGHHSGRDGKLYTDMRGIDTALQLVDRVLVAVGSPNSLAAR